MTTVAFLLEWAVRSSILIGSGALLICLLRLKNSSVRLSAWTALLCGSLAMPLFTTMSPKWPSIVVPTGRIKVQTAVQPLIAVHDLTPPSGRQLPEIPRHIDWATVAVSVYALVAGWFLLRLAGGILVVRKLWRTSRATGLKADGIEVRESEHIPSPITVGIVRPTIMLPADWPEWQDAKLKAVLAHERSHAQRRDPAVQFLSAVHRALLWHSPLTWMLHRRIIRLAEEASDDAAVAVTHDRATYAETVLDFMRRGVRVNWHGAAMARYGRPGDRIDRILDNPMISTGMTRKAAVAVVALAAPLAYFTAAAVPTRSVADTSGTVAVQPKPVMRPVDSTTMAFAAPAQAPTVPSATNSRTESRKIHRYLIFLGDTQSGNQDSSDPVDTQRLRAKFGQRFVWLSQSGVEYVITDATVLSEIERAMEPQKKVNAAQDRVNQLQSVVNGMQEKVNSHQDDVNAEQHKVNTLQDEVNAAQDQVNKRQDLLNRIQKAGESENNETVIRELERLLSEMRTAAPNTATQDKVNRLQVQVNEAQERVNELQQKENQQQGGVNAEQQKVNAAQEKVNEEQERVSSEFSRRIQEIFESALRRGLAQRL